MCARVRASFPFFILFPVRAAADIVLRGVCVAAFAPSLSFLSYVFAICAPRLLCCPLLPPLSFLPSFILRRTRLASVFIAQLTKAISGAARLTHTVVRSLSPSHDGGSSARLKIPPRLRWLSFQFYSSLKRTTAVKISGLAWLVTLPYTLGKCRLGAVTITRST